MHVITLQGSPRKDGNTARVLGWVEEELLAKGHTVDRVNIAEYDIQPCQECYTCQEIETEPGCEQIEDDAPAVFDRVLKADVILIATPLFCWSYTAQLKLFIDRCYCLVKTHGLSEAQSLARGKRIGLLVTGAGDLQGNIELIVPQFQALVRHFMSKNAGSLLVPNCTVPDAIPDRVRNRAKVFANDLVA